METIELSNEIWVVNTFSLPVAKATVKIGKCKNIEEVKEEIKKHAVDLDLQNKRFELKKKDGDILDVENEIAINENLTKQTIYVSVFDSTEKVWTQLPSLLQPFDIPGYGTIILLNYLACNEISKVYVGLNIKNLETVVIKIQINSHEHLQSLEREYSVLKLLEGPHVPQILSYHIFSTFSVLVTSPLGIPLNVYVSHYGPFDIDLVMKFCSQILPLLNDLHSKKQMLHRDIKPSNLLYCSGDQFCLIDFGISCKPGDSIDWKQKRIGTPLFMSRMIHNEPYKIEDDMESFTFTLVFLLNGFCPWEPENDILYSSVLFMNKCNFHHHHLELFEKIKTYQVDDELENLLRQTIYLE